VSALDDLKSVLTGYRSHVAGLVNSGALVTIDRHLGTLELAANVGGTALDEAVHWVLGELYGMWHPTAAAAPVEGPAAASAPVVQEPAPLATGGLVSAPVTVLVGEHGPELDFPGSAVVQEPHDPEAAV
jgi:hypothetical protein